MGADITFDSVMKSMGLVNLQREAESLRSALVNEIRSGDMWAQSDTSPAWKLLAQLVGEIYQKLGGWSTRTPRDWDVWETLQSSLQISVPREFCTRALKIYTASAGAPAEVPAELVMFTAPAASSPVADISFVKASFDKSGGQIRLDPKRILEEMTRQYGLPAALAFKKFCAETPTEVPKPGQASPFVVPPQPPEQVRAEVLQEQLGKAERACQELSTKDKAQREAIDKLTKELGEAREAGRVMMEAVEQLKASPLPHAYVLSFTDKSVTINRAGQNVEVLRPKVLDQPDKLLELAVGQTVKVMSETMQIVEPASKPPVAGAVLTVLRAVEPGICEVEQNGQQRAVTHEGVVEEGDRVVLDFSASVVVKNLGKPPEMNQVDEDTGITWDDIGGLEEAKRELREAIEAPILHAERLKRYGKKPSKGVLLYGGPGLGKTMLAKAAATALKELHAREVEEYACAQCNRRWSPEELAGNWSESGDGKCPDAMNPDGRHAIGKVVRKVPVKGGFYALKGPELLDKFIGETEAKIRRVFAQAKTYEKKTGHPATIFIDEAEAILGPRGTGLGGQTRGILSQTVVPQFLAEMDGLEASGAFVILATNRPQSLDSAVVRDGRMDRRIRMTRPTKEDATVIALKHLVGKPLQMTPEAAAKNLVEALYDPSLVLYRVKKQNSVGSGVALTLAHLASGAMIAGVVDRAVQRAMRRSLELEVPENTFDVPDEALVRTLDLTTAVARVYEEARDVNHEQEIQEFTDGWEDQVVSITRERARPTQVPSDAS